MTGYAFREWQGKHDSLAVELKGYNHRYLDVSLSVPPGLGGIESRIRAAIAAHVLRGRVEVYLRYRVVDEPPELTVDETAARAYADALRRVADACDVPPDIRIEHLLSLEGIVRAEPRLDADRAWGVLSPVLEDALAGFDEERTREGHSTLRAIEGHILLIADSLDVFRRRKDDLDRAVREDVARRFREVAGDRVEEDRLLAEVASLLIRYNIDEEIDRLAAHLDGFRSTADEKGAIGRRLDFLCQEINREVNTVGSKAMFRDVSEAVVHAKDAVERIREQLRNIE
jgi:uncharacterized protein (TIGR00255 family)